MSDIEYNKEVEPFFLYMQKKISSIDKLDLNIQKFNPRFFKLYLPNEERNVKSTLVRLFFCMIARKRFIIYYCCNEKGELMHTSFTVSKCIKFPFLTKNDCHIGPCETYTKFRGQGIYPKVLRYIISDYNAEKYYMIVHESNASSIRGIEKAGFEKVGCVKKNIFKIFKRV